MRLALVIAPPSPAPLSTPSVSPAGEGAPPSGSAASSVRGSWGDGPTKLAAQLRGGGFRVVEVLLTVDFSRSVSRALGATNPGDTILVCLAGEMRLGEDLTPRIRIAEDTDAIFELGVLGRLVKGCQPGEALYIMDLGYEGADDAFRAAELVDATVRALRAREDGVAALVGARALAGARPAGDLRPGLSTFLIRAFDEARELQDAPVPPAASDGRGAVTLSRVIARLRAFSDAGTRMPSFAHVDGKSDFVILQPEGEVEEPPVLSGSLLQSLTEPVAKEASPSSIRPAELRKSASNSAPPTSGPPLDELVTRAVEAEGRGAWDLALDIYKTALMVHGAREGEARAGVYARIAAAKLAQGKPREAELNYEKALDAFPGHAASFDAVIGMAATAGDWRRVIALRQKARAALGDVPQLLAIAAVYEDKLKEPRGTLDALAEARLKAKTDPVLLGKVLAVYERMGKWLLVVETLGDLRAVATDAKMRAEICFVQADVALARMRDEARGLPLLEVALDEDPTHEKALQALVAVCETKDAFDDEAAVTARLRKLERVYARLIDKHAARGDLERAWDTCKRLGMLRRDRLNDAAGALDAFEGARKCKPGDVESRAAVADLLMSLGQLDGAAAELQGMAADAPTRVATFRKLFELHTRRAEPDRAWLVATALEELKAADMDHQLIVDQFRPEPTTAVRPASSLDDDAWDSLLRAPGADPTVAAILRAVGRAAVASRVTALKAQKKLFSLSPQRKQSPTSTVSIVRTFVWASQILGVPLPELYVYDDVPGGLAAVPGEAKTTAIGPAVLSGMPLRELAFVVGRHLAYYRPEHHPLIFFPTLAELSTLFLAAASIAVPKLAASPAALKLRGEIEKQLAASERQELAVAVTHFDAGGGKVDLASWIRGVELTATRAGLLLSGDLAVSMRVLRRETRAIADVSLDDKRADLLACCASVGFGTLRQKLGIAPTPV